MSFHLSRRPIHRLLAVLVLLVSFGLRVQPEVALAAATSGALSIEPIAAYNFVVDSNVESPSTYAPQAGTLAAKVCNNGSTTLTDVFVYIGNRTANTPGVYPSRTNPTGLTGTYALTHEGGSAGLNDATRYIPSLAPGQCVTQYWLVSYPRLDGANNSVTGGIKPDDDLWLEYDMWASANEGGTTRNVDATRRVTMRNEISAAANKIWPNGTAKVPQAYLDAIATAAGWGTFGPVGGAYPGETVSTQGIWYDLGNVGFGFDNNGDGTPDQNAWLQPVGDPSVYDPGCFRLVRTYGLLVVKLVGGGEQLIPFENQLYFQAIPNNTGVVGLVFYEYVALDGACTGTLTPYQEVASGYDNEKFSGDYGFGIPPLQSREPAFTLNKTVNLASIPASPATTLNYTVSFANTGPVALGNPAVGVPIVISERIPDGTDYLAGSATTANVTMPAGVGVARVLFSTNNGISWTATEPAAANVTNIQWWFNAPLPAAPGGAGNVRFSVTAPVPLPATTFVIPNTAGAGLGNNPPMITSTVTTLVQGPNSLSGNVFRDNGVGGLFGNSTFDGSESLLPNVLVTLYRDSNNNGLIDVGEPVIGTTAATYSGLYSFGNLPDGNYITRVDITDGDIPTGWTNTTRTTRTAALDSPSLNGAAVIATGLDFGFAPALVLDKNLLSPTSPLYEGELVTFGIDVSNKLPGSGTAATACSYIIPATIAHPTTGVTPPGGGNAQAQWSNPNNALGLPNGTYAGTEMNNNADFLGLSGFNLGDQGGSITSVQYRLTVRERVEMRTGDYMALQVYYNDAILGTNTQYTGASAPFNTGTVGSIYTLNTDITGLRSWTWADFANNLTEMRVEGTSAGGNPAGEIDLDSASFVVTTTQTCGGNDTIISTVPVTDTFDTSRLQFVSAVPPTDSTAPAGTLTWNNVGPLYPGQAKTVQVTFRVLAVASDGVQTINYAGTTGARYANGRLANNSYDNVLVTINQDGSISGRVFRDVGTFGWVNPNGFEAGDASIPGVTVQLFGCVNNSTGVLYTNGGTNPSTTNRDCPGQDFANGSGNGTWRLFGTTTTAADGTYSFVGLRPGFYVVKVANGTASAALPTALATSTLPTGATQRAEASDTQALSAGFTCPGTGANNCDGIWGNPTSNISTGAFNPLDGVNEAITNVNFGYSFTQPTLYGRVWHDYDNDGIQDANEPPLVGVTVYLCTTTPCTNTTPGAVSTTTNANGGYSFSLAAGTYYVGVTNPNATGPLATGTWSNTYDTTVPGPTLRDSQSDQITVAAGSFNGSYDFGYRQTGTLSIGDTLYYDWDVDGTQDGNEEGIRNVTLTLYRDVNGDGAIDATNDFLVSTTSTNQTGFYNFTNLPPGRYYVFVDRNDPDLPSSYAQTQDPDESGVCVTCNNRGLAILTDANNLLQDFGYRPVGAASIGDTVWYDRNGDQIQSGNQEVGLPNVTVSLEVDFNGDGVFVTVRTASTDASGRYLFTNLPNASYRVVVDTADTDIPNDTFGNNYAATTATTRTIVLSSADNLTADFGFTALGAIGDTIFWDSNRSGGQDYGEPGINGVTVRLYNDVNNDGVFDGGDTLARTQVTATNATSGKTGEYLFTGLPAGEYLVVVDTSSAPIAGRPLLSDPEADGVPCTTPGTPGCDSITDVTLYPAANYMGADFGYLPTGVLGDTLWVDADNDGVRDGNEAGIAYVTVNITGPGCAPCSAETDANGNYLFTGLGDGSYSVVVNTADADFIALGPLDATYEPNGTLNNQITVVMAGGVATQVDGSGTPTAGGVTVTCASPAGSCDLIADFGYRYVDPAGFDLSGTVCLDGASLNGLCGAGITGVDGDETAFNGTTIFLYRWNDDGDGLLESGETVYAAATTTNATGDYSFLDLPAATGNNRYIVSLAAPTSNLILTSTTGVVSNPQNGPNVVNLSAYRAFNLSTNLTNQDFAYTAVAVSNYDFGDLPASYSTTLQGSPEGARHRVSGSPTLYLGATPPDSESNATPTVGATSDGADEDGVTVVGTRWNNGTAGGTLSATVIGTGYLVGWIDFNRDGDFSDGGEMVINQTVSAGSANYLVNIPSGTFPGTGSNISLPARFRLFSAQPTIAATSFSGPVTGGEVEDYVFNFSPTAATLRSFTATKEADSTVTVRWTTDTEYDVLGYQLWRADSNDRAAAQRVTSELIMAEGSGVIGAEYRWTDSSAPETAHYWLESVHTDGSTEEYGPVTPIPAPTVQPTQRILLPLVVQSNP